MPLLDNVVADASPLVVTLDFSKFTNGAKLSTLFRSYFESFKGEYELADGDYESYVALNLLTRLKEQMKVEATANTQTQMDAVRDAQIALRAQMSELDSLEFGKV